jgi:cell division protein FtsW
LSASSVTAIEECGSGFCVFTRQVVYAGVGVVALVVASRVDHGRLRRLAAPALVGSFVLLLLALHPASGVSVYGASRWLRVGPVTVQPSEFAKLALIVFAAAVLSARNRDVRDAAQIAMPLAPAVAAVAAVVMLQRDFGTAIILCGTVFILLFVAGARPKHLLVTGAAGAAAAAVLVLGEGYRRTRLLSAFHPFADPRGAGYQTIQGYIALASGGWLGVGLGASRQKWQYVPNAHTDFIAAILGEELGFVGEIVLLGLFGLLLFAGVRIAVRAPDRFGRLLAAGITGWLGLQAVVNLGAVTGLLPVTGVPLPLVSYGGSALVVSLAGIGVLAGIGRSSAHAHTPGKRTAGAGRVA